MPGLVKVGYTNRSMESRLQQLNTTGTPEPFQVSALFYVQSPSTCEQEVHSDLQKYRDNPKREFFSADVPTLIKESFETLSKYMSTPSFSPKEVKPDKEFTPDEDDVYFMFYMLHDSYESNKPYSAKDLVEHHSDYAPLELELKFMRLEEHGFVKRVSRPQDGLGLWQILPKGVKFMMENNHHAQDLINESKPQA